MGKWDDLDDLYCPVCKQETVQFVNGMCKYCNLEKEAARVQEVETKKMRAYYRRGLREGTISLAAMREGRL